MQHLIRPCAPAALVLIAGVLTGCAPERPESVPGSAQSVARQNGTNPISFTAPEDGRVYVFDVSTQKMVYSGRIDRGETLDLNPRRDGVVVDGKRVVDTKLRDLNEYQVWYDRERAPTVTTAGATAGPSAGTTSGAATGTPQGTSAGTSAGASTGTPFGAAAGTAAGATAAPAAAQGASSSGGGAAGTTSGTGTSTGTTAGIPASAGTSGNATSAPKGESAESAETDQATEKNK